MKSRFAAAVFCLLASFSLSVGAETYITTKSDELIAGLDKSLCAEDGSGEMYDAALAACGAWEDCKTLFGSFLKHTDADDLDRAYGLIREYVKNGNVDELKETLEECRITVKVISDGEKPRAENIF